MTVAFTLTTQVCRGWPSVVSLQRAGTRRSGTCHQWKQGPTGTTAARVRQNSVREPLPTPAKTTAFCAGHQPRQGPPTGPGTTQNGHTHAHAQIELHTACPATAVPKNLNETGTWAGLGVPSLVTP